MVVGFDISTRRLDWAWLNPHAPTVPCHRFHELGKGDIIDRTRNVVNLGLPHLMTEACLEYPYSINRQTNASLMAVLGALTNRIDRMSRVAWMTSGDLRAAIGARNNKADAHERIRDLHPLASSWDEHALDALVACQAWTTILDLQERT